MATAVFAAALLALPAIAHADTVKITDASLTDGVYTILTAGDYELDTDNCTGINVGNGSTSPAKVQINLNGKTISNSDNHSCISVIGSISTVVTIENGTLTQSNTSNAAFRVDGTVPQVTLTDVNASSVDHQCIDVEKGSVVINGNGGFSTSGSASVLRCSTSGTIEVHGGSFTGSSITGDNKYKYQLYGGTYSSFPEGSVCSTEGSENGFFCNSEGKFEVKSVSSFKDDAEYALKYKDGGISCPVYFANEDDATKFKNKYSEKVESDVQDAWFDVTFNAEGGTPASVTQKVLYGTSPDKVEDPQSDDGVFSHWKDADGTKYEFGELYEAATFTAVWNEYVAQAGDKKFTSLQDAVDAIEDGSVKASEIKLLADLEESVTVSKGDFTLSLNGKTLTGDEKSKTVVTVAGPAKLTIENGTLTNNGDNTVGVSVEDTDADVTIADLTIQDADTAIKVSAGKVTTGKGFVGKSKFQTLRVSGSAHVIVEDGTFSSTSDSYLYIDGLDEQGSITINGGEFSGMCVTNTPGVALKAFKIKGGIFENWADVWAVADGKAFLEREDGRFEVVDLADAKAQASWVVSDSTSYDSDELVFKVYFRDETNARECYKMMDEKIEDGTATIKAVYHLEFVSQDKTVEVRGLEEGEAVGELPAGKEIARYEFLGWYLNGNYSDDYKLSAETVLEHDSKAVALWKKVDTDEATSDPIDPNSGDSESSSSSSDSKSSPETGDAGAAALGFVALGSAALAVAARRRKTE